MTKLFPGELLFEREQMLLELLYLGADSLQCPTRLSVAVHIMWCTKEHSPRPGDGSYAGSLSVLARVGVRGPIWRKRDRTERGGSETLLRALSRLSRGQTLSKRSNCGEDRQAHSPLRIWLCSSVILRFCASAAACRASTPGCASCVSCFSLSVSPNDQCSALSKGRLSLVSGGWQGRPSPATKSLMTAQFSRSCGAGRQKLSTRRKRSTWPDAQAQSLAARRGTP